MKALLIKTNGETKSVDLPRDGAHTVIHDLIGGYFDCVSDYELGVTAYVHDEGLLINLPTNNAVSVIFSRVLAGDAVLVGLADDEGYDTEVSSDFMTENFSNMVLEASRDWELSLMLNNSRESMDLTPIITEWRN